MQVWDFFLLDIFQSDRSYLFCLKYLMLHLLYFERQFSISFLFQHFKSDTFRTIRNFQPVKAYDEKLEIYILTVAKVHQKLLFWTTQSRLWPIPAYPSSFYKIYTFLLDTRPSENSSLYLMVTPQYYFRTFLTMSTSSLFQLDLPRVSMSGT